MKENKKRVAGLRSCPISIGVAVQNRCKPANRVIMLMIARVNECGEKVLSKWQCVVRYRKEKANVRVVVSTAVQ